jgi:hypothetical protein
MRSLLGAAGLRTVAADMLQGNAEGYERVSVSYVASVVK